MSDSVRYYGIACNTLILGGLGLAPLPDSVSHLRKGISGRMTLPGRVQPRDPGAGEAALRPGGGGAALRGRDAWCGRERIPRPGHARLVGRAASRRTGPPCGRDAAGGSPTSRQPGDPAFAGFRPPRPRPFRGRRRSGVHRAGVGRVAPDASACRHRPGRLAATRGDVLPADEGTRTQPRCFEARTGVRTGTSRTACAAPRDRRVRSGGPAPRGIRAAVPDRGLRGGMRGW